MKYFTIILCTLIIGMTISSAAATINQCEKGEGYFASVPAEDIHTMKVWEDGSFEIVYKDQGRGQTSETGCLPGGSCND